MERRVGWFEKKVGLVVPQEDGTLRKVKVPKSSWDKWVGERKVRPVEGEAEPQGQMPTEGQAAALAVRTAMENAERVWHKLMANYRDMVQRPLGLRDEKEARRDFALAIIAFELGAVANLFPAEQARRLQRWTLRICQLTFGAGAPSEMAEYHRVAQHALDHPEGGELPHDALWWRLLERWLGSGLKSHEVVFERKRTGLLDPLLPMVLTDVVCRPPFLRTWKEISEGRKLVEGA
ncbi:MAG: hypothetical protein ACHP84_01065 [Caulobacterales bacterium]